MFLLCLVPFAGIGQENKMETDRPGQTVSPSTVLKNHLQVEAGFRKAHNIQDGNLQNVFLYPSALVKYGVTKSLELRVLIESEADYEYHPQKHVTAKGLQPITIGFKYNLSDEKGILPKTSFAGSAAIPKWASPDFQSDFVAPAVQLAMENSISEKKISCV